MATNFNENFVQWNSPKMHIFSATRIVLGVTCFFNIVAPEGGHKIFDHQMGSHKYCRDTFGNSWPPFPKKMVAPPYHHPNFLMYGLPIHESAKVQSIHNQLLSNYCICKKKMVQSNFCSDFQKLFLLPMFEV